MEYQYRDVQVLDHAGVEVQEAWVRSRQLAALWLALPDRTQPCTHMLMFCLAFSMSFLISGVMLNRSFLGMGRGTIGDRTSSGFFLHGTGGLQAHVGVTEARVSLGLRRGRRVPAAGVGGSEVMGQLL